MMPAMEWNGTPRRYRRTRLVGVLTAVFNTLIILISLFLIFLILIQRGKGGGLAGAFGGVGGSSAFGTKAGDTFTRVTVVTASIWILMAMLLVVLTSRRTTSGWGADTPTSLSKELGSSSTKGKGKAPGSEPSPALPSAPATAPLSGSTQNAEVPAPPSSTSVPAIPKSSTLPETPGTTPKSK
jgi:preprotein translocase subunit SecG